MYIGAISIESVATFTANHSIADQFYFSAADGAAFAFLKHRRFLSYLFPRTTSQLIASGRRLQRGSNPSFWVLQA